MLAAGVRGCRRLGGAAWDRKSRTLLVLVLVGLTPLVLFAAWAWRTASRVDLGRAQDVSVLYTAGQIITPGLSVEAIDLTGTLRRLGYREIAGPLKTPGQFRRGGDAWEIFLRAREDPGARRPALSIRLALEGLRVAGLDSADGGRLEEIELEPELLTGLGDTQGQLRRPVQLAAIPKHLITAVLAAEDHRFFEHRGVDARAIFRALWINLRRGGVTQGGSTLTQQLVKNLVLTPKRTWDRKIREAALALALERRYSKSEILEAYLNGVYLGQRGSLSIYGLGAAAQSYFGNNVERLTLSESALLAGMIRAPNSYSPIQHAERARERRDAVLRRMRDLGLIDESRFAQATRERIRVQRGTPPRLLAPYFVDYVRVQVEQSQADNDPPGSGLRIYTTLDPVLQRAAEGALSRGLDRLEGQWGHLRRRDPAERLQGALVVLDPKTGEIRAMVGGRDYAASQFNRVTQARRQPGSAFKPFVYLAALGFGPRGEPPHFTPVSLVEDRPLTLRYGKETWTPRNYESRFEGTVTVRRALEQSLNAATVWLTEGVGLEAVIRAARQVGFTSPMVPVPALSLGSFEVAPIELAAAYVPFANGGERVTPTGLRAVVDREGGAIEPTPAAPAPAIRTDEAFLLTYLLTGVVERGTGAAARALGVQGPVAGKTGTTNDGRDAWFVGYTPRLVTLVWVGFDERDVLRLSGGQAALPIWADFMRTAMAVLPSGPFVPPPSIAFRDVDPTNGKLANHWCPVVVREAFLASTEPREVCADHGPGDFFKSFFRRFFELPR